MTWQRDLLGLARDDVDAPVTVAEQGAHALVGLDGGHVSDTGSEEPREDAGTGSYFEDVDSLVGNEPVQRFIRWA